MMADLTERIHDERLLQDLRVSDMKYLNILMHILGDPRILHINPQKVFLHANFGLSGYILLLFLPPHPGSRYPKQ